MNDIDLTLQRTQEDFDFSISQMTDLLEQAYLEQARENKPYKRQRFPPSSVGYLSGTCPRRWYYEFNEELIRDDAITALQIANMNYGSDAGDRMADLFQRSGILIESEREVFSKDPPIRGYIDLVVNWNDQPTIGEVKTTKQEDFTLLRAAGKPRGYQLMQLLIYMKIEEAQQGFMLYENRNTGEILVFPVYMNEQNKEIIDNAFIWFQEMFANEELPQRPFAKSSKECKYCPFKAHCWDDPDGNTEFSNLVIPE